MSRCVHRFWRETLFGYLRFVARVAIEHLAVKNPFPISGDVEVLDAPGRGH